MSQATVTGPLSLQQYCRLTSFQTYGESIKLKHKVAVKHFCLCLAKTMSVLKLHPITAYPCCAVQLLQQHSDYTISDYLDDIFYLLSMESTFDTKAERKRNISILRLRKMFYIVGLCKDCLNVYKDIDTMIIIF